MKPKKTSPKATKKQQKNREKCVPNWILSFFKRTTTKEKHMERKHQIFFSIKTLIKDPHNRNWWLIRELLSFIYKHQEFTREIMMMLDTHNVLSLREEFEKNPDGLSLHEFVHVMKKVSKLRFKKKTNISL